MDEEKKIVEQALTYIAFLLIILISLFIYYLFGFGGAIFTFFALLLLWFMNVN